MQLERVDHVGCVTQYILQLHGKEEGAAGPCAVGVLCPADRAQTYRHGRHHGRLDIGALCQEHNPDQCRARHIVSSRVGLVAGVLTGAGRDGDDIRIGRNRRRFHFFGTHDLLVHLHGLAPWRHQLDPGRLGEEHREGQHTDFRRELAVPLLGRLVRDGDAFGKG